MPVAGEMTGCGELSPFSSLGALQNFYARLLMEQQFCSRQRGGGPQIKLGPVEKNKNTKSGLLRGLVEVPLVLLSSLSSCLRPRLCAPPHPPKVFPFARTWVSNSSCRSKTRSSLWVWIGGSHRSQLSNCATLAVSLCLLVEHGSVCEGGLRCV